MVNLKETFLFLRPDKQTAAKPTFNYNPSTIFPETYLPLIRPPKRLAHHTSQHITPDPYEPETHPLPSSPQRAPSQTD